MNIIVGGVIEKDGKFLLVQEAKRKCYEKWNFPAGHLEVNETLSEGAIREIYEETGCKVDLTGVLQIVNRKTIDDVFLFITFSTKILNENVRFNKNEILDVKWFDYNEIMNMKNELRDYNLITDAIKTYRNDQVMPMKIIKEID